MPLRLFGRILLVAGEVLLIDALITFFAAYRHARYQELLRQQRDTP
jgi:hypothetical protein